MPRFDQPDMEVHPLTGSGYSFSAAKVADLGASEYTLVALAADCSSSVASFASEIEDCIAEVVRCCGSGPRADNLMLRFTRFNERVTEVHGYKPLAACPLGDYKNSIIAAGGTALCDAAMNAVESLAAYSSNLDDHDFDVNGIVFVITDGEENSSKAKVGQIKRRLAKLAKQPGFSSVVTVLVGVGVGSGELSRALETFKKKAGFDRYIQLERADASALAQLAEFVSRSIGVQSQSLATGAAAPRLGF